MACKCSWASAVLSSAILKWHLDICFGAETFLAEYHPQLILCSCGDLGIHFLRGEGPAQLPGDNCWGRVVPILGKVGVSPTNHSSTSGQPVPGSKWQDKRKGPQVAPREAEFGYKETSLAIRKHHWKGCQALVHRLSREVVESSTLKVLKKISWTWGHCSMVGLAVEA